MQSDKITLKTIIEYFNLTEKQFLQKTRKRQISYPKQIYSYICRDKLKMTYKDIALTLDQDHSTVVHSSKHIKNLINLYPNIDIEVKEIISLIVSKVK